MSPLVELVVGSELYYLLELVERLARRHVNDAGWTSRAERRRFR
jgi:hypothetical protein